MSHWTKKAAIERMKSNARLIERLVGWYGAKPELRTERHSAAVLKTLDDVLPPDHVDLYAEGKEEG